MLTRTHRHSQWCEVSSLRKSVLGVLALPLLLASQLLIGCSQRSPSPADGPQVPQTLPDGWEPLKFEERYLLFLRETYWHEINIDGDPSTEYLLFFTFENGQIGAVIYDHQAADTDVGADMLSYDPNQPSGKYVPYRIQPSFWTGAGEAGMVAPPGTLPDQIKVELVRRIGGAGPFDELNIYGGSKILTVIWWRNEQAGYGQVQIPGTSSVGQVQHDANDASGPVVSATGLNFLARHVVNSDDLDFPAQFFTRSQLCEERLYVRRQAPEADAAYGRLVQNSIDYDEIHLGIAFCQTPPAFPLYPEGVVLAFLKSEDRDKFFASQLSPEARQWFLSLLQFGENGGGSQSLMVRDLLSDFTVRPERNAPRQERMCVCAQISPMDNTGIHMLMFMLEHRPPVIETVDGTPVSVSDRFYIVNMNDATGRGESCRSIMPVGTTSCTGQP